MILRAVIRRFDAFLRKRYGVYEFSQDEWCWLRLSRSRAPHDLHFPDLEVGRGAPILMLHLWNEHSPSMPSMGPDLAWTLKALRLFVKSLRAVADQMKVDPNLRTLQAVGGITVVIDLSNPSGTGGMFGRLGFVILPYHSPLGRFGEFWENFYTWGLMWAYNPGSLRNRSFLDLRRSEFWMETNEFMRRFGQG
jgi:hypothetical protein